MNVYVDELESLLEDTDFGEFEERARPVRSRARVRTPSSRSSFQARQAPTAASQSQVQAATRTLDAKIETLSRAVKDLEGRTAALTTEQTRTSTALAKEVALRKRSIETTRNDLQQTRMLSVLLPMLTQGETTEVVDEATGKTIKVLTASDSQFASMLPLLLLTSGGAGTDSKGLLGDSNNLLLLALLFRK